MKRKRREEKGSEKKKREKKDWKRRKKRKEKQEKQRESKRNQSPRLRRLSPRPDTLIFSLASTAAGMSFFSFFRRCEILLQRGTEGRAATTGTHLRMLRGRGIIEGVVLRVIDV